MHANTLASVLKSECKANEQWPGRLPAMLAAYRDGTVTLADFKTTAGIDYRAAVRLLKSHGVEVRPTADAINLARKLNPAWAENISRSKLLKPYRHPLAKQREINAKHKATLREHPERHVVASAPMTRRERAFADILEKHRVRYEFNKPAGGYWLDFYLPDLRVGIEVQKNSRLPDRNRTLGIINTLRLRIILYVPNIYFFNANIGYVDSLVWTLTRDADSIDFALGDAVWLCQKQSDVDARWYGFGFKRRWSA